MVTWPMLDAISVVIAAREEARRAAVAAHSRVAATHLAPEEVAEDMDQQQRQLTKQARAARHRAKTASNHARREEATQQPGGMCQWCGRQQHPCRTQCWVCEKLICDRCTYHDSEDRKYLLCNSCFARRGSGPLEVEGRVVQHSKPSRCDKALDDMTGHVNGSDLVECTECYRWLCALCARDDGPPHRCRVCPEVSKRQGNLQGPSLLSPFSGRQGKGKGEKNKGGKGNEKGKGKKGKGKVTHEVAWQLQDFANELTQKGASAAAARVVVVVVVVVVVDRVGGGGGGGHLGSSSSNDSKRSSSSSRSHSSRSLVASRSHVAVVGAAASSSSSK